MKKYILVPAVTNSEWDTVNFALIPLTNALIEQTKNIQSVLLDMKERYGVNEMTVWNADVTFCTDIEQLLEIEGKEDIPLDESFAPNEQIIELESIEDLYRPESDLDLLEVSYTEMQVTFRANGKHTGEEFWCTVNYETILQPVMA